MADYWVEVERAMDALSRGEPITLPAAPPNTLNLPDLCRAHRALSALIFAMEGMSEDEALRLGFDAQREVVALHILRLANGLAESTATSYEMLLLKASVARVHLIMAHDPRHARLARALDSQETAHAAELLPRLSLHATMRVASRLALSTLDDTERLIGAEELMGGAG